MQQAAPEAVVLAVGQQHADLGLAVGELAGDGLDRGAREPAVRALDQLEGNTGEAELAPLGRQCLGMEQIDGEVDGTHVGGMQRARVLVDVVEMLEQQEETQRGEA